MRVHHIRRDNVHDETFELLDDDGQAIPVVAGFLRHLRARGPRHGAGELAERRDPAPSNRVAQRPRLDLLLWTAGAPLGNDLPVKLVEGSHLAVMPNDEAHELSGGGGIRTHETPHGV